MNEELQSTNDELQLINDVLRLRGEELDTSKAFAASTLRSLGSAVVVVDSDLRVYVWGPGAEDLWGLRTDEATGRPFADLDIGLPVADIAPLLKQTLAGKAARTETVIEAMNRRGRTVRMLLECLVLRDEEGNRRGVIMVMNEAAKQE
jgi:two-component system CheB/CheR fusion protein